MKTMNSLIVLSLLSVVSIAPAQAERSSDRDVANAFFAKGDALVKAGKIDAYFRQLYSPAFYAVDTNGKRTNLPEFKAQILSMVKGWKNVTLKSTVKNVQLTNTEMMVWVEEKLSYRHMHNGRWMPMVKTDRYAYNLVQVPQGWAMASCQQLPRDEPWSFKTTQ